MSRTSNWNHIVSIEHAASVIGDKTPYCKDSTTDAMSYLVAITIDWLSVPLRLYTDFLIQFCSSPDPETNSGMLSTMHDHVSLTGTARGHVIVSRTLKVKRLWLLFFSKYSLSETVDKSSGLRRAFIGPILNRTICPLKNGANCISAAGIVDPQ